MLRLVVVIVFLCATSVRSDDWDPWVTKDNPVNNGNGNLREDVPLEAFQDGRDDLSFANLQENKQQVQASEDESRRHVTNVPAVDREGRIGTGLTALPAETTIAFLREKFHRTLNHVSRLTTLPSNAKKAYKSSENEYLSASKSEERVGVAEDGRQPGEINYFPIRARVPELIKAMAMHVADSDDHEERITTPTIHSVETIEDDDAEEGLADATSLTADERSYLALLTSPASTPTTLAFPSAITEVSSPLQTSDFTSTDASKNTNEVSESSSTLQQISTTPMQQSQFADVLEESQLPLPKFVHGLETEDTETLHKAVIGARMRPGRIPWLVPYYTKKLRRN